jgi:hypothetical protein
VAAAIAASNGRCAMSEKHLFVVTTMREVIVVADSFEEAREGARLADFGGTDEETSEVVPMATLPGAWELSSIPYGHQDPEDPDRPVGAWIALGAAPEYSALEAKLAGTSAATDPSFEALFARSSLGTPEAVKIRKQANPKTVAHILARADDLQVARDTIREVEKEARAASSVNAAVDLLVAELVVEVSRRLAAERKEVSS